VKSTRAWATDTSKQDTDLVPTIQTAEDNLKSSESPQREKCYKVSTLYRLLLPPLIRNNPWALALKKAQHGSQCYRY